MIKAISLNNIYSPIQNQKKTNSTNFAQKQPIQYLNTNTFSSANILSISFRGTRSTTAEKDFGKYPQAAVVDFFDDKCIDVDGDLIADLSHKDMVKLIAKATFPEAKIVCFNIGKSDFVDYNRLSDVMSAIADRIKDKHDIDAVNLSAYIPTDISSLSNLTGISELNSENIHLHKKTIREWFKNPSLPNKNAEFNNSIAAQIFFNTIKSTNKAITSIEKITFQGVPVYISAGNEGSNNINYLTFADGTISVGANDINGSVAHYSAKHSLVNLYERGSYEILPIIRGGKTLGYNITGGNNVQIPYEKTSHGDIYVNKFNGKNINDVLADNKIINKLITLSLDIYKRVSYLLGTLKELKEFQNYLFPVEILAKIENKSEKETIDLIHQGDYCTLNFKFFFKLDDAGKIVFCPAGRPNPKAVNKLWGTSFSSPRAMMAYLKHKFP